MTGALIDASTFRIGSADWHAGWHTFTTEFKVHIAAFADWMAFLHNIIMYTSLRDMTALQTPFEVISRTLARMKI